jgi:hypothetical protein
MRRAPQVGDHVYFQGWPRRVGPGHGCVLSVTPIHWFPRAGGREHEPGLAPECEWIVAIMLDGKMRPWLGRGDDLTLLVRAFELSPSCGQKPRYHARGQCVSLEVRA